VNKPFLRRNSIARIMEKAGVIEVAKVKASVGFATNGFVGYL